MDSIDELVKGTIVTFNIKSDYDTEYIILGLIQNVIEQIARDFMNQHIHAWIDAGEQVVDPAEVCIECGEVRRKKGD